MCWEAPPGPCVADDTPSDAPVRQGHRHRCTLIGLEIDPRAISSAGRAPPRQGGGHWFEPSIAHVPKALLMAGFFDALGSVERGSKGLGPWVGPRKRGPDRAGRQIRPFAGAIRRPCGVHPFAQIGTVGVASVWHLRSAGGGVWRTYTGPVARELYSERTGQVRALSTSDFMLLIWQHYEQMREERLFGPELSGDSYLAAGNDSPFSEAALIRRFKLSGLRTRLALRLTPSAEVGLRRRVSSL